MTHVLAEANQDKHYGQILNLTVEMRRPPGFRAAADHAMLIPLPMTTNPVRFLHPALHAPARSAFSTNNDLVALVANVLQKTEQHHSLLSLACVCKGWMRSSDGAIKYARSRYNIKASIAYSTDPADPDRDPSFLTASTRGSGPKSAYGLMGSALTLAGVEMTTPRFGDLRGIRMELDLPCPLYIPSPLPYLQSLFIVYTSSSAPHLLTRSEIRLLASAFDTLIKALCQRKAISRDMYPQRSCLRFDLPKPRIGDGRPWDFTCLEFRLVATFNEGRFDGEGNRRSYMRVEIPLMCVVDLANKSDAAKEEVLLRAIEKKLAPVLYKINHINIVLRTPKDQHGLDNIPLDAVSMEAFRAMVPTIETIGRWVRDLVGMDEDAIARHRDKVDGNRSVPLTTDFYRSPHLETVQILFHIPSVYILGESHRRVIEIWEWKANVSKETVEGKSTILITPMTEVKFHQLKIGECEKVSMCDRGRDKCLKICQKGGTWEKEYEEWTRRVKDPFSVAALEQAARKRSLWSKVKAIGRN